MKKIIVLALMILTLSVSAMAAVSVTYDIQEGLVADTYQIVATIADDEGDFRGFSTELTFDSDVIIPVNKKNGSVANIAGGIVATPITLYTTTYYDEAYGDDVELTASVSTRTWTAGENGLYTLLLETYVQPNGYEADGKVVFSMHFKYADGASAEDITADVFKIDRALYSNGVGDGYYYGCEADGYETNFNVVDEVTYEAPVATEYWNAGNGYNLHDMVGNVVANNSPVTKSNESETAVTVKYGGYYQGADNWAGAALKEAVTIDGLEVEVTYTTLPTSNDCWAYIGVLAYPAIFSTNASYNNGYVNLIRYSAGNMSVHGTTKWETVGTYGDGFFALENGDVLRVCFDKNEEGTYDITYVKNNTEVFTLPIAIDLEAALGGTTGYVVASASCKGSEANAFEYTVNTDPEELAVAKIPVAAGDTVYEYVEDAGYTITKVTANGTYDIILADGDNIAVIVNSGYTSQKAYSVSKVHADGYFVEMENFANGVLGSDELSVRIRSNAPQGIRFFGTVKNVIAGLDNFDEYGFIMTAESTYNALPDDYVLDMALVEAGKAKKGVAKDTAGTDIYFERTTEATVIAGVFYGVPKTVDGVKTVIASRPYYKLGDACVYGEVTKATLYDIAKLIYNVEGYEVAWEYAKEIIEIVEGDIDEPEVPELDNEIAIDVSELYK